jgi:tetratricopeptide (TPR) repeat protein
MWNWTGRWIKQSRLVILGGILACLGAGVWRSSDRPAVLPDAVDLYEATSVEAINGSSGIRHARRQFNALIAKDEQSRKETDQWIHNTPALEDFRYVTYNNMLSLRVEHRLKVVAAEYQAFIAAHPRIKAAKDAQAAFVSGMNEKIVAIKEWEQIRQSGVNDGSGWAALAHYYSHTGPIEGVFKCYEKALEVDARNPANYENLATAIFLYRRDAQNYYQLKGEQEVFDKALEVYGQALAASPEDYDLASDIAESYYVIRPNRVEDALQAWQTVLKIATTEEQREEAFLHLARFEIHAGRFDEARQYLDRVNEDSLMGNKETILRNLQDRESQARHPVSTALPATKS